MIEFQDITKKFFSNKALDHVSFTANSGEILALLGQNGAGKSTLMKILSGVYRKDSGKILIDGGEVDLADPNQAEKRGIGIVYQELSNAPHLTVAENIMLGNEPVKHNIVDKKEQKRIAGEMLGRMGIDDLDLERKVMHLSVSQQQICEIAKCMSQNPRIVIFDEPTTSLTSKERKKLFEIMKAMKEDGLTILFITHYLDEAIAMADRCVILKDGMVAYHGEMEGMTENRLVSYMIGRKMGDFFPEYKNYATKRPALEVEGLSGGIVKDVKLKIHYGEVVGLSGLIGSGRTELAHLIIGETKPERGTMKIDGKEVRIRGEYEALKQGIGYVNEDRRTGGLNLNMSIEFNMSLPSIAAGGSPVTAGSFVKAKCVRNMTNDMIERLAVKCSSPKQKLINLSGGNQQKVSIGKWIASGVRIMIFDEPTKGIDVLAKAKIYEVIRQLAEQGCAILVISSYNSELQGVCDRIDVMSKGRITGSYDRNETEETLMLAQQG